MSARGHPADRRGDGLLHRRRRLCAGDVRRGDHRARPGHDLPRRPAAGEGRDRRDRHRRGSRRRRCAHAPLRRRRPLSPRTTRTRSASRGASSAISAARRVPRLDLRAPRAAALRPGRAARHRPARPAHALRRARGHRPHRRRLRIRRVQARATAPRWSAASRTSGACRSASSPTTASCSRNRAQKGAHFIELCCQRGIPLLFLQNITGFMVGRKYEAGGIAKDGAKLVTAVATRQGAEVHRHHRRLLRRRQLRHVRPRLFAALPVHVAERAHLVMGGEQAASVLATVRRDSIEARGETWSAEDEEPSRRRSASKYEREGDPLLRHRAAVGRRHHRPGRDARRARPRHGRRR